MKCYIYQLWKYIDVNYYHSQQSYVHMQVTRKYCFSQNDKLISQGRFLSFKAYEFRIRKENTI